MTEKIDPKDNESNMQNANLGSDGTNRQYDQNQGNRGYQMNPETQDAQSGSTGEAQTSTKGKEPGENS